MDPITPDHPMLQSFPAHQRESIANVCGLYNRRHYGTCPRCSATHDAYYRRGVRDGRPIIEVVRCRACVVDGVCMRCRGNDVLELFYGTDAPSDVLDNAKLLVDDVSQFFASGGVSFDDLDRWVNGEPST
jgi:hypothetical protein